MSGPLRTDSCRDVHSPAHLSGPSFPDGAESAPSERTGWLSNSDRNGADFLFFFLFSGQAGQTACLRDGKQEAHLKSFPESKWWDAVGRLVAPLSRFLSSSHQSVGGGGAPIHRSSTQQLHTPHQIMPALPTRKLCDSYSLRRSHQTGSLCISVLMRLLRALSALPLHSDSICQGSIKSLLTRRKISLDFK